ncbi:MULTISPECIES: hypothetical protein [unclassified Micromonospora]|uniref:hypothetical protein n=1 Tax=unclassified Micromonospora TaxID=2617518 RepID=UPI002FF35CA0
MSRRFPIPRSADDPRFTFALALDVAQVLTAHGYPSMTEPYDGRGADLLALQQALFSLNYGTDVSEGHPS